jgi:hypothetical protein
MLHSYDNTSTIVKLVHMLTNQAASYLCIKALRVSINIPSQSISKLVIEMAQILMPYREHYGLRSSAVINTHEMVIRYENVIR